MHLAAYLGLVAALVGFTGMALYACWGTRADNVRALAIVERGQIIATAFVLFSATILLSALVARNYSFLYVYRNVDSYLPFAYTLTAFWAGREGSLLFWEVILAGAGALFVFSRGYLQLNTRTKLFFWVFYLFVQVFFLYLLTTHSNPFVQAVPTPPDGRGMNPLLQNPGMIFHPPLLFLGYALFTLPACAALAAYISGEPKSWIKLTRNWNVMAWAFLSAGIILGGWWSYMELGWGGYWAWDPVENASLIPWFSATAFMHTALIEQRRGALQRTNVFLMVLTFNLCVFGTYIVRSGVIDSLHAFGGSGVGSPLALFMLFFLALPAVVLLLGERPVYRSLSGLASRQGLLIMAFWGLLAVGFVIGLGTMWPVISKMWSANTVGLDQKFYNRVCLPILSMILALFGICPWMGWKEGVRNKAGLIAVGATFAVCMIWFFTIGIRIPLALFSASVAVAGLVGIVLLFVLDASVRNRNSIGAYAVHLGLVLMGLGIAFSGPYQQEREVTLQPGQSVTMGDYTFTYKDYAEGRTDAQAYINATLVAEKDDAILGALTPERRIYTNFEGQVFAEASTIPRFGDELYATLLGIDGEGNGSFKLSIHPLVNWVWIGGVILCLAPFLLLRRQREV